MDPLLEHRPEAHGNCPTVSKFIADCFNAAENFRDELGKKVRRKQEAATLFSPAACAGVAADPVVNLPLRFLYASHFATPAPADQTLSPPPDTAETSPSLADGYIDVWSSVEFQRCGLRAIDATRIALPPIPACPFNVWLALLLSATRPLFASEDGGLLGDFRRTVSTQIATLPSPRISTILGHYPRVVARAAEPGMIVWTRVSDETACQLRFSDAITITSFAVC